ncbi:MAG: type II toxin-antitoxin system HipA family toxin [Alphaproteobacteria bacterium]|nr:type II toxin-antitoxin system HipA family toxin [Alphaproteobacteria bacterium]
MTVPVEVDLWGRRIGAVVWPEGDRAASFEYDPAFVRSGIQVAPLTMPLSSQVHQFPTLPAVSFHGLPGMLADVLPDRFGNAVIDAWLARQGRTPDSFGPLDRLCYIGERAMGALTFQPARGPGPGRGAPLEVAGLVELASQVLNDRLGLHADLSADDPYAGLLDILRVGTSAGGARAKALVAWNPDTGEVRSGQVDAGPGFGQWLLKFDGVANNRDRELADPLGYGAIELAYHQLALAAGIEMMPCRLLEEGGRRHFMTRRFDRTDDGGRLHMQTLAALAHLDFHAAGAHGYEQAITVMRRLELPMAEIEQLVRRMVFNVVARNQDDHVKNIAFLMDKQGRWRLAPAYDVTWSFNPDGAWTRTHQMTVHGKRDGFDRGDLEAVARAASLRRGRIDALLDDVVDAVRTWPQVAADLDVDADRIRAIGATHRLRW